jgi:hypothetical protein
VVVGPAKKHEKNDILKEAAVHLLVRWIYLPGLVGYSKTDTVAASLRTSKLLESFL